MPILDLPPADLICRVVETRAGESARVQLRIEGPAGTSGRYSIRVGKSDAAGTADLQQAGTFPATTGGADTIGNISLRVGAATALVVDARIEVEGRNIACRPLRVDNL